MNTPQSKRRKETLLPGNLRRLLAHEDSLFVDAAERWGKLRHGSSAREAVAPAPRTTYTRNIRALHETGRLRLTRFQYFVKNNDVQSFLKLPTIKGKKVQQTKQTWL